MKLRFWLTYTNYRGKSYGAGTGEGQPVHVRGHEAGVEVTPRDFHGHDVFDVYGTRGSNGGMGGRVRLGRLHDTKDGPYWEPDHPGDVLFASTGHVAAAE